ncbi:MAG: hypothetical protein P1P84_01135 [Deferrisomatales bacterium]|nr:hypothetical protein [Deferrisomatales bacterium]
MRLGAGLLLALVLVGPGCAPRGLERAGDGAPIPPARLAAVLSEYNGAPAGARVQGRLRLEGRGSAVFGATAVVGQGLRLDAVSGAFSRPLLSVACTVGGACRIYLPEQRRVLVDPAGTWGPWLLDLTRGRLPVMGKAREARRLADGAEVLQLSGRGDWLEEVEFAAGAQVPRRAVFSRAGVAELEVELGEYMAVDGQPFPGAIAVQPGYGAPGYRLEFRQVTPTDTLPAAALRLEVPPGTAVETLEGTEPWTTTQLPLWLPAPHR